MSLFGPVDDGDRRLWQQQNLTALTELIKLGATKKLPPLMWRLPDIGDLSGTVDSYSGVHHPRAVFEAWMVALGAHKRVEPLGLGMRSDLPPRSERTDDTGRTRLMAGFTIRLTDRAHPARKVVLIAEWWEDEVTERLAKKAAAVTR